jgi:hypothetical protein
MVGRFTLSIHTLQTELFDLSEPPSGLFLKPKRDMALIHKAPPTSASGGVSNVGNVLATPLSKTSDSLDLFDSDQSAKRQKIDEADPNCSTSNLGTQQTSSPHSIGHLVVDPSRSTEHNFMGVVS